MFDWPENVMPLPSRSFSRSNEYSNARSRMDSGRARQRPRYTEEVAFTGVVFELDTAQLSYFKGIWEHKLNNGNDWFTMRLPMADGEILTLQEVRFISDFQETYQSFTDWEVSAQIEYRDPPTISEEDLNEALYPDIPPTEPVPPNSLTYGGNDLYFEDNYLTYN